MQVRGPMKRGTHTETVLDVLQVVFFFFLAPVPIRAALWCIGGCWQASQCEAFVCGGFGVRFPCPRISSDSYRISIVHPRGFDKLVQQYGHQIGMVSAVLTTEFAIRRWDVLGWTIDVSLMFILWGTNMFILGLLYLKGKRLVALYRASSLCTFLAGFPINPARCLNGARGEQMGQSHVGRSPHTNR